MLGLFDLILNPNGIHLEDFIEEETHNSALFQTSFRRKLIFILIDAFWSVTELKAKVFGVESQTSS